MGGLIALLILLVLFAVIPAAIAGAKGRSRAGFYLFGLLMFAPALVVAMLIVPDESALAQRERLRSRQTIVRGKPSGDPSRSSALTTQLAQLVALQKSGALTADEYEQARIRLIDGHFDIG